MIAILNSASDPEIIARNAGLLLEIASLPQTVGDYSRSGLLAIAVGHLEQHLTLLESITKGVPSTVPAGESRVSALVKATAQRYGSNFDPDGHFVRAVIYTIEVRNSIVHREGRIDRRFISLVGEDAVPREAYGGILDTSAGPISEHLDVLTGFSIRACLFAWTTSSDDLTYSKPAMNLARGVFGVHSKGFAQQFLTNVAPLDWP